MGPLKLNVQVMEGAGAGDLLDRSPARSPAIRRWPISFRAVGRIALGCDVAIILITCVFSGITYHYMEGLSADLAQYLGSAAVVSALFCSAMKLRGMYEPAELLEFKEQTRQTIVVWLSVLLFLTGVVFSLKIGKEFSRGGYISFAIAGLVLLVIHRSLWRYLLVRGLAEGKFSARETVLITTGDPGTDQSCIANLVRHGFQLQRHFSFPNVIQSTQRRKEAISEVLGYLRGSNIQEVVVSGDLKDWLDIRSFLSRLRVLPLPVTFIPIGAASDLLKRPSSVIGDAICIELHRGPLSAFERSMKRAFDFASAATILLLFSPLLLITAIAIKLESPGPVLFRQRRCGFNGIPFRIFKFRTMSVMEDSDFIPQAERSDNRVTLLGRWLRRTSIDELPQLLNVIDGSMSLVGPRPHAIAHDNAFDKLVSNYAFRNHVKPGLTGWAQVHGVRGPTPSVKDVERRVEYDLWYIDNWSFALDFVILLRTIVEVLRSRNAF
jgi:Undecaprenyl-phosphate glucose phosphotransferase